MDQRTNMKVIIAGSREFKDYELLKKVCDEHLEGTDEFVIISGTARGADKLGEDYAIERGQSILRFPADWDKYGKSAGYKRNEEMAKVADMLIAFWDGESRGTKHMIDLATKYKLKTLVWQTSTKA